MCPAAEPLPTLPSLMPITLPPPPPPLATRRRAPPPLLADYTLWPHGVALVATLYHCRSALVVLLQSETTPQPSLALPKLCARLSANAGHLAVALRTLRTIGWVVADGGERGDFSTQVAVTVCACSATLASLLATVYDEGERSLLERLAAWLPAVDKRWASLRAASADVPYLRAMLDGAVLAPLLLELRHFASASGGTLDAINLAAAGEDVAAAVGGFFARQDWGEYTPADKMLRLTRAGRFLLDRCLAYGVCLSYRSMLVQLGEATFGEAHRVFERVDGHEAWVDRRLNVIASGFMHARYFDDMLRIHVRQIFDATSLNDQPRVVADMGCGDGTLLKKIFTYVKQHTMRGQHLKKFPLSVCGIDYNDAALAEAGGTLHAASVPHELMHGDIGDPATVQRRLEAVFGVSRDEVQRPL